MKTEIRKYGLIFITIFFLMNQVNAQWETTNFPNYIQVNALAVKDSLIFAGTKGYGMLVSSDNGMNWIEINNGLQNKVINAILIDDNNIYVGNELGVSISTDNGNNWTSLNNGLANLGVWSLAVNKDAGISTLYAGTWNGVYSSTDNGRNWEVTGLSSTMVPVNSVLATGNLVYATTNGDAFFQSTDKGNTWKDISFRVAGPQIGSDEVGVKPTYALAKMNSNVVVSVGNGFIAYRPITAKAFLNQTNSVIARDPIISFASRGKALYCASVSGEILYSVNDGATWKAFSPDLKYNSLCSISINNSYMFAGLAEGLKRLSFPYTNQDIVLEVEIPKECSLSQNYPNPFNPSTTITFTLPQKSNVKLVVYDVLGKEVATLANSNYETGKYSFTFNGSSLSSGMYFYTLTTSQGMITKKMMLVK